MTLRRNDRGEEISNGESDGNGDSRLLASRARLIGLSGSGGHRSEGTVEAHGAANGDHEERLLWKLMHVLNKESKAAIGDERMERPFNDDAEDEGGDGAENRDRPGAMPKETGAEAEEAARYSRGVKALAGE